MFKKIWNKIKEFGEKIIDVIVNGYEKVRTWFQDSDNTDTVLTICTVLMTTAAVAMVVRVFIPVTIASEPAVKISIPLSALLAATKKGVGDA